MGLKKRAQSDVSPAAVEAARGMGMSAFDTLMRVELPLAVPVIMTGVRTALVLMTGTAALGGFVNATGGGGWGPVVTSTLLTTGPTTPRRVIGSVSASEFVVTVCASVGFLLGLGLSGLHLPTIGALMAGGVVAAPLAAAFAGRLPAQVLGVAVGSMILNLNLGPVLTACGASGMPHTVSMEEMREVNDIFFP